MILCYILARLASRAYLESSIIKNESSITQNESSITKNEIKKAVNMMTFQSQNIWTKGN